MASYIPPTSARAYTFRHNRYKKGNYISVVPFFLFTLQRENNKH